MVKDGGHGEHGLVRDGARFERGMEGDEERVCGRAAQAGDLPGFRAGAAVRRSRVRRARPETEPKEVLLGKTQAIYHSAEWNAMVDALRGFGSDGAAVVGGADDIVPVKAGAGSEATPYPDLVERSERAMSILWRGADLGTQSHSGSGKGLPIPI